LANSPNIISASAFFDCLIVILVSLGGLGVVGGSFIAHVLLGASASLRLFSGSQRKKPARGRL